MEPMGLEVDWDRISEAYLATVGVSLISGTVCQNPSTLSMVT